MSLRLSIGEKEKEGHVVSTVHDAETETDLDSRASRLRRLLSFGKDVIEVQGIERIPEDQRTTDHSWNKYEHPNPVFDAHQYLQLLSLAVSTSCVHSTLTIIPIPTSMLDRLISP